MTVNRRFLNVLAIALAATWLGAQPALADVIVLSAKGGGLKAGETLSDQASIDLPAGASAELLLPSGAMRAIKGPTKTTVSQLTKGEKADQGLFDKVAGLVNKPGATESQVGGMRSAAIGRPKPLPFSWTGIPLDADGDWCVEKGASLTLVRPNPSRAERVTVVDVAATQRIEVTFEPGQTSRPWPEGLAAKTGSYALILPDKPMRQIRMRLISPLPAREETVRVLHGQRCDAQLRTFLNELTTVAAE